MCSAHQIDIKILEKKIKTKTLKLKVVGFLHEHGKTVMLLGKIFAFKKQGQKAQSIKENIN